MHTYTQIRNLNTHTHVYIHTYIHTYRWCNPLASDKRLLKWIRILLKWLFGNRQWWRRLNWAGSVSYLSTVSVRVTASWPALGPTQPPIQWVTEALSEGLKRLPVAPKLIKRRAIPPFTHTSSWRGALLSRGYVFMPWYLSKFRENFTFTFTDSWVIQRLSFSPSVYIVPNLMKRY